MDNKNGLHCGAALLVLCAVGVAAFLIVKGATISDWAAWVQAVGSIGAIWGAYRAAERQFERERTRRQEDADAAEAAEQRDLVAQKETIVAIAIDSVEAVYEFQDYAARHLDGTRFQLRTARLEDAQYALRGLLVRPLIPGAVTPILDLQRSVSRTLRDAQRYYGKSKRPDAASQDIIYGRSLRAMKDAEKIPGFRVAWQQRQQDSMWPSTLLPPPYGDESNQ